MKKVLLIDDDYTAREGICFLLDKFGMKLKVHEETNGKNALEYLKENRDVYAILTDIEMPYMDGLEFCSHARSMCPKTKIVIFSAYNKFEYAQKAIDHNVSSYILKPVRIEEFRSMLEKIFPDELISEEQQQKTEAKRKILRNVKAIIEQQFRNDISVEYLAKEVHLSPSYLSTIFKRELGVGLIKYINEYRLQEAEKLLSETNMRIKDISIAVGFDNIPYFSTLFKEKHGVTPAEFRERK